MALLNTTQNTASGVLGMFGRARSDVSAYRARVAKQRQVYKELNSLSSQELNDLGINAYDIARIVRETR